MRPNTHSHTQARTTLNIILRFFSVRNCPTWIMGSRFVLIWGLGLALCEGAARPTHWSNTFSSTDLLELRVYVSSVLRFSDFDSTDALVWHETGITYDAGLAERTKRIEVPLTDHLISNGTLYAHIYVSKEGATLDPKAPGFDRWASTVNVQSLVAHAERLAPMGLYNLLTGEPAPWEEELRRGKEEDALAGVEGRYIPYWKPGLFVQARCRLTIPPNVCMLHPPSPPRHAVQLVVDLETHPLGVGGMPQTYEHFLRAHRLVQGHKYRPLIYVNELTLMRVASPSRPRRFMLRPAPNPRRGSASLCFITPCLALPRSASAHPTRRIDRTTGWRSTRA